ncbi:hypothetical protein CPC08DRAFT_188916 [Agrocybe pediades]|nr:hypothetical protein CPC08DRAFT_188916 [Agrocybe pediades]
MDGPQHYQTLSYALQPPPASSSSRSLSALYSHPTNTEHQQQSSYHQPEKVSSHQVSTAQPDEEEEEDDDDDDEGMVEEQLSRPNDVDMHGSNPSSPKTSSNAPPQQHSNNRTHEELASPAPEHKRRPGRPRGSKNRRPRIGSTRHENQFYYQGPNAPAAATATTTSTAPTSTSAPPQHPNITAQNQQYYEFQWRVLNLCAEFYGAAEELVKGTPPLVIAQCYHMGPGVKIDPLVILSEAKRICDNLLQNPSQLVTNPPPSIYPTLPTPSYQSTAPAPAVSQVTPVASTSTTTPAPSQSAAPTNAPSVITNAQTFVVPLNTQPTAYSYPVYPASTGQYTTASYYPYAYPPAAPLTGSTIPAPQTQPIATITTTPATGGTVVGNQGAWSDEETERLRQLAEKSKTIGPSTEIDWDWVIQEWGISRTRHQILIKATAMGLKESSTRVSKRRRETDPEPPSLQQASSSGANPNPPSMNMAPISSPAHSVSQSGSTPSASPALQHQQRPSSSKGPSSLSTSTATAPSQVQSAPKHVWPMPTMPVNSALPMQSMSSSVQQSALEQQQKMSSYYRPRPNQVDVTHQQHQKAAPQAMRHEFSMYAPQNGQGMRKENGQ